MKDHNRTRAIVSFGLFGGLALFCVIMALDAQRNQRVKTEKITTNITPETEAIKNKLLPDGASDVKVMGNGWYSFQLTDSEGRIRYFYCKETSEGFSFSQIQ